jgi:Conjugative transposon protein TcpC
LTHLRRDRGTARRPRRIRAARTPAELARATGRALLWCLVAVLLLRGASDVLATPEQAPVRVAQRDAPPEWPDEPAGAFAARFTRAYLGYSGGSAHELTAFAAPDVAESIVPQVERRDRDPVVVDDAQVARAERIDHRRALLTVAATVTSPEGTTTRHLAVPVARDDGDGLVVFDLPSFAAPPPPARYEPTPREPLTGTDAAQVEDVLERFFRAYLAGRSGELEYLVPAGARIAALEPPAELAGVDSAAELEPGGDGTRLVLATVRARDLGSRAVYELRYRVRLVRGDRWYVAAINTTRKEG